MTPARALQAADAELAQAEQLLEVAVVAKRLKRCPETIRRYIRAGLLKATRPPVPGRLSGRSGGNYLVAESAVRAFLLS